MKILLKNVEIRGRQGCHLFPNLGGLVTKQQRVFFISTIILSLQPVCPFFLSNKKGGKMSKPELKLIGEDGNVFFILGKAVREARRAGWSEEKIGKFKEDAMSGDYNHVLQLCMEYFDVI
jgi:hypothetical protein